MIWAAKLIAKHLPPIKAFIILFVFSLSANGLLAGRLYDKDGYPQTLEERKASDDADMWKGFLIYCSPLAIFAIWFFTQQTKK
jgi:hypothetical protein